MNLQHITRQIEGVRNEWQVKALEVFIDSHPLLTQEQKQDLLTLLVIRQELLVKMN